MGFLCCEEYVKRGGNAVLCDINPQALDDAVNKINEIRKGSAIGVVCDVRDYTQVCNARDKAVELFGTIDLLVNFAGGAETRIYKTGDTPFPDIPIEVFDWGLDVNLKGQFYFDHAVMKQMQKQKNGVIINIGSIVGAEGAKGSVAYSTAKSAAMEGLTKSIAVYGGDYGVRCCCVSPGPVLTRASMSNMKTLLGYAAEPIEIVELVLYLASDIARSITGVNILADGGRNVMKNKG